MEKYKGLILNTSYDDFVLGANINNYLDRDYWKERYNICDDYDNDFFFFKEGIGVWCDIDGTINTIDCDTTCVFKGIELIGMKYSLFLDMIKEKPYHEDIVYLMGDGPRGKNHHVYDFDNSGLQVWTWRGKIRQVLISKSEEDE